MIRVQFWGTRGSITTPGPTTWYYGGLTPCVEVIGYQINEPGAVMHPQNPHLILDGGSGLDALQPSLMAGPCGRGEGDLYFLMSNYHWDHVIGLPFFLPMFVSGNHITFYGDSVENLYSTIERLFTSNYSPLKGAKNLAADLGYYAITPNQEMDIAGFRVQAAENQHPGNALSYRIRYGSEVVVYSTDHEIGNSAIDAKLLALARGAHVWIMDAMYNTADPYQRRQNWGHSTHLEAVNMAIQAGVKIAVLFHHAPDNNDQVLGQMGREAAELAANTPTQVLMARDGLVLDLGWPA